MEIEDILKQKIVDFLSNNCNWESAHNLEHMKLNLLERKNASVKTDEHLYKYIECSKLKRGEKVCVGIGFNPAEVDPNKIDNTNCKIIKSLKEREYSDYILLNLFPLVTPSKKEFDESDEKSIDFSRKCLPELLEYIYNETTADVLIFWGRTVSIDNGILEKIQKFCDDGRLYMTVKEGENIHCHPARIPIDIQSVIKENIKQSNYIR